MREFKFRVWHVEGKKLIYFPFMHITYDGTLVFDTFKESNYLDETFDKTDKYVLMQYTGLKDKNGREIYEGDIVKLDDGFIGEVDYGCVGGCSFRLYETNDEIEGGLRDLDTAYDYKVINNEINLINGKEIIGNIYENPKLIKE
jgi:uncharacterized phage protein (TIGR01671 family)